MELDRFVNIILTDGTNTYSVSNEDFGVEKGTLSLNEIICEKELSFGNLISNKFECSIFFKDTSTVQWDNLATQQSEDILDEERNTLAVRTLTNPDLEGMTITVKVLYGSNSEKPIFKGKIESATTDNFNLDRKIVAYDDSYYLRDIDVLDIYNAFFEQVNGTPTLKGLRDYLCNQLDITYTQKTLVNDNTEIHKAEYSEMKFGDLISSICELQCCFPNFNRSGVLEFVTLSTTQKNVADYEVAKVEFEDYTTQEITGIKVYENSSNLVQTYPADAGNNALCISGNIFLLDMDADEINTVCYNMLPNLTSISYKPCKIPMIVSDIGIGTETQHQDFKLGDLLVSSKGSHYVFEQDLSGSLFVEQKLVCEGDEYLPNKANSKNNSISNNRKFSSFEQDIDGISATVGDLNSSIAELRVESGAITGRVTQVESVLEESVEEGKVVATVVKTEEGFTFDNDGLTISKVGSDIETNINEEGMTISSGSQTLLTAKSEQEGRSAGVEAYRLKAKGYISIGDYSRFMDYQPESGVHRTGCFWIEEND